MIQVGLSPDLILDGLRIVKDELAHAELSHRVFVQAGGTGSTPIARESLELRLLPGESLERAITRTCINIFCLGETVAVPLFKALREECSVPVARRLLDRVLRDEVRHRDFGWSLLAVLLELPIATDTRGWVEQDLPLGFEAVRRAYASDDGEALTELPEADRRWGLIPPASYAAIVERTLRSIRGDVRGQREGDGESFLRRADQRCRRRLGRRGGRLLSTRAASSSSCPR